MSNLFLNNASLNNIEYQSFKEGIFDLILIEKKENHIFWKNFTIYELPIITEELYTKISGQEEQEIYRFIEQQLKVCDEEINTEEEANTFCKSEANGFLGIDFSNVQLNENKQVRNKTDYDNWCYIFHSKPEELLIKVENIATVHLADHHGKKELGEFCKKLKQCPYVINIQSTDWGGKKLIRKINNDNSVEIVLYWTEKEYALKVFTTGRNQKETEIISNIILEKYDK
jgi:hypothetical protein